jgi:hypothetical protein
VEWQEDSAAVAVAVATAVAVAAVADILAEEEEIPGATTEELEAMAAAVAATTPEPTLL